MSNSYTIAKNTFRQALRDRILYGIIIFALIFIGSTLVLSSLSLGEDIFIIRNFGLTGIYVFGLIITLFLGASVVYDEVERKTTYLLLSKPATKTDIITGKFLGLLSAFTFTTLLMLGSYLAIVAFSGGGFDTAAIWVILLQLFELGLLIGTLILFSIFTTPLAAIIYTILLLYVGHLLSLLKEFSDKSPDFARYMMLGAYYLFPNLEKFNIRNLAVHEIRVPLNEVIISMGYASAYIIMLLILARILFNKKEL